ncbi:Transcription elongation factor (TFIIS) family protein [Klebsormidium nitens]|uniref:Transcription elongation factor (TFIIS) family protein n=1 Tax=Klebsormidium nitens TaxID=105231 RepID=A0A1Y1I9X6_KLENI|nr:Transcription elongation factor (TFIIS) family protein [Klebsormidium nitens]|eukprot:GAQ85496.1 Transcription elongation factor (TFIIS) family protein [Klebsormidium nitens]
MARNKTPKFAWRSFFAASGHDIWAIIAKAIEVAAEDEVSELRKRRDGIVEQMYRLSAVAVVPEAGCTSVEEGAGVQALAQREGFVDGVDTSTAPSKRINPSALQSDAAETDTVVNGSQQPVQTTASPRGEKAHQKVTSLGAARRGDVDVSSRTGYADEEELQVAIEQDSLRMQEILLSRSKLSAPNKSEEAILQAMASLERMNITVEELKATEIGKTISSLRKHPAKPVQIKAKHLVKSWKELVEDFQAVTNEISKKSSTDSIAIEGGLEAPPLDAATLASRNTSAELSQLLEDFTAEDLAAGLEKLSSTVTPGSAPVNSRLAFLSPVYDPRPPASRDSDFEAATNPASAASEPSGVSTDKETREKAAAEKWQQAAKLNGVPEGGGGLRGQSLGRGDFVSAEVEKKESAGERSERSSGVVASGDTPKRARSLKETDVFGEGEGPAKKARVGEGSGPDGHRTESLGTGAKADVKSASERGAPSAQPPGSSSKASGDLRLGQDRARSKTPEAAVQSSGHGSNPARASSSKPPGVVQATGAPGSQLGGRQPGKPGERPRSGTPELPVKLGRPSLSPVRTPVRPVSHSADGQKPLPKPHSANNFLQFNDTAKRATAPPRRNPEMRDPPPKQQSGVEQPVVGSQANHANGEKGRERHFHAGGVSEARKPAVGKPKKTPGLESASDDDLFDELDPLPRARKQSVRTPDGAPARRATSAADVGKSRTPVGSNSGSEPETGLEEEDGFLSDSDSEEMGDLLMEPANKLEETKRRLHEKYLQAENAKKSRTTLELKAGDVPTRKKALGHSDRSKARGSIHSKLSKLARR